MDNMDHDSSQLSQTSNKSDIAALKMAQSETTVWDSGKLVLRFSAVHPEPSKHVPSAARQK